MPNESASRMAAILLLALLLSAPVHLFAGEGNPPVAPQAGEAAKKASLFEKVLQLNLVQEPELDLPQARAAFDALMDRARAALAKAATPKEKVAALNETLLSGRSVTYLSNMYWRDATLAAALLRKQANCLGTSTLYVVAGEALELPVKLVIVPGHAFARWDDGATRINIETTNKGREIADEDYLRRTNATEEDIEKLGWGKSLDAERFYAELLLVAAQHRRSENKVEAAIELMEQAEKLAPGRSDVALQRLQLIADLTNRRDEAARQIARLAAHPDVPPSVRTGALVYLAGDAAARGDHEAERRILMVAFKHAPKSAQSHVLQQLAFCHRALKDWRGARRYMELAVALEDEDNKPVYSSALYNLAILQKNDGQLGDALKSIRKALTLNPESWNLKMIEAGYMVLNGERDAGIAKFEKIEAPRGDVEFYEIMRTWFLAVSKQREKFYAQFEHALSTAAGTHIFEWIDQDVDLDVYRGEPEFKALVAKHRTRLFGKEGGKTPEGKTEKTPVKESKDKVLQNE